MGLKELKEDFYQAVNELMPGADEPLEGDDMVVNTLEEELDTDAEMSKLDGLLEDVSEEEFEQAKKEADEMAMQEEANAPATDTAVAAETEEVSVTNESEMELVAEENTMSEEIKMDELNEELVEETPVDTFVDEPMVDETEVADEVTVITEGTAITGDIAAKGSIDIQGRINGNVSVNGKLVVTGTLEGDSHSSEFFADAAHVVGEVNSTGTVKIGIGSVVIGNITATSAVIAGAIKGDIDVHGPIVVDTSAVVMGNIKSRSVQINNGAVIEGFCSQSYADIDVKGLFESQKGN